MEDFSANLTECANDEAAANTFNVYASYTYGNMRHTWMEKCPVPCVQKSYGYSMKQFHANSWLNPGTNEKLTI